MPRMQHAGPVLQPAKQPLLRWDGAVLITGGLGDLGQRVARWLASAHSIRDLVLTSRRGMASPGAAELVAALAGLGAKATIIACDMADFGSVKAIMAAFNKDRPLRGVVHAAGAQDNGVLSALTPQRCATAFAPKVDGAWHLRQLTRDMDMDMDIFVMFSSVSGIMGMPGHGTYAAANTFLDALAHLRHAQGLPATSLAYGTWKGEGMAARIIGTTLARLTHLGLDMLSPEEGLQLFEMAVRGGRALTVAAALDPERLQSCYEEQGGIPPLFRSLLRQSGRRVHQSWDLREVLSKAAPEQHPDIVLGMVRETVAKALGFALPDDVDIDSLTAVLMRNQLANLTGLTLAASVALQHPNLKALSQFLLFKLQEDESDSSCNSSTPPTELVFGPPWLNMAAIEKGCLDANFRFDNAPHTTVPPRSVFVTGATGFVGAFIVHELRREIVGNCPHLKRGSAAGRINGVQFDPIELIVGKDRNDFASLELGPAHPSRGDSYSKPGFRAGNNAIGRCNRYRPLHGYGFCFPRSCEIPAAPAGKTRAENAVMPGEIGERSRHSLARKIARRGNGHARGLAQQSRAKSGIRQPAQSQGHIGPLGDQVLGPVRHQ